MAQPPELNYLDVSPDEMVALVGDFGLEARLATFSQRRIPQQQDPYHEQFCCKKELVLLTDSNDDEIAIIIEQIHVDPSKGVVRTIAQIRVGNVVYRSRLP